MEERPRRHVILQHTRRIPTSWSSRSRPRPASTISGTTHSAMRSTSSSQPATIPRFAVDLAKVDYLSSSGVAILVGLKRRVETKGGKMVIYHVQPIVHDLLAIMKLDRFFTITEDEAKAVASLASPPHGLTGSFVSLDTPHSPSSQVG